MQTNMDVEPLMEVEESGSEGEKQLLCLFRSLQSHIRMDKLERCDKERSTTTEVVGHRGFQSSDGVLGGAGVLPQVVLFHLLDVVHGPIHFFVFECPFESRFW